MTQYAAQPQTFRQWPRWARLQREWREFGKAALAWAVVVVVLAISAALFAALCRVLHRSKTSAQRSA